MWGDIYRSDSFRCLKNINDLLHLKPFILDARSPDLWILKEEGLHCAPTFEVWDASLLPLVTHFTLILIGSMCCSPAGGQ